MLSTFLISILFRATRFVVKQKRFISTLVLLIAFSSTGKGSLREACARLKNRLKEQGFAIERKLFDYYREFREEFIESLAKLGSGDVWLDSGAGEGGAIYDYQFKRKFNLPGQDLPVLFNRNGPAAVVAVNMHPPSKNFFTDSQLSRLKKWEHITGERLETVSANQLMVFGKINLITDVYGPLAYSLTPHLVLKKYFEILANQGEIFVSQMPTTIIKVGSETLSFYQWLRSIDGVNVRSLDWLPHDKLVVKYKPERFDSIAATKPIRITLNYGTDGSQIRVPRLKLVELEDNKPLVRTFEQRN